ncbi:putative mitochondrial protein [Vitis vinifera]|uniref:Putative mitochondrial protein n=1 Tax=Vitis vinifera TaxID=29760 RepID=A0A438GG04_VITVI|nr:putative mitochondrial protein [Vitis vinifera]
MIIILIYVDDIIVIGSNTVLVHQVVSSLHSQFALKDLGILNYLLGVEGTTSFGLSFYSSLDFQLTAYADADWVGCPDDRRSTSGHCIFFGSNLVSWSSSKQKVVSRSSNEAEYRALANAASELQWIQHLLQELSISSSYSPICIVL